MTDSITPYVPGFEYDIFISYSQLNDAEKWVTKFHKVLDDRLKERVSPGAKLFRDTKSIQGDHELTPEITRVVRNTAILVPIVSHSYIKSRWCQKECKEFIAANQARGSVSRIFPVCYDDVSPAEFQQLIGERIGHQFYALGQDDKYKDTLLPRSDAFRNKMNTLRIELGETLKKLKSEGTPSHQISQSSVASDQEVSQTIFLAEPGPGLDTRADELASYLKAFQIEVMRPGKRFYEGSDFERTYSAGLHRSLLFVQLLGRYQEPRVAPGVRSWDQWQFLQAQAAALPTEQWFNKYEIDGTAEIDPQSLEADHRNFVTQAGVWNCDPQRFRESIRSTVAKLYHDKRQTTRGLQPLIVLRADRSDKAFAEEIGMELRKLDCDWLRVSDKDVTSLEDFAKENAANGLLVVYRTCPGKWVLARLQEVRRFLRSDFGSRWKCGLWHAPDDSDESVSCSVDGLFVIEPRNRERLQEFIVQLRHQLNPSGVTL